MLLLEVGTDLDHVFQYKTTKSLWDPFSYNYPVAYQAADVYERQSKTHIRASVDALCRDGTSEISRDPRTKRLQTRRERLARPSKHTNNNF